MISGRCRLILTPTLAALPFIGALQAMFLSVPEIDFDFDGAARLATKLPAIKERIRAELVEDMSKELVFPERLTLPLSWSADPEMVWHPQVTGMLVVRIKSVKGLPKKGGSIRKVFGQDKPDVYGRVNVGSQSFDTTVVKNSVEAGWPDTHMEWLLEEAEGHWVEVTMYDRDKASSDEFLGYARADLSNPLSPNIAK